MTDPRPICPIPPDAKVGDVVVLRCNTRHAIMSPIDSDQEYRLSGVPSFIHSSGKYASIDSVYRSKWECVEFIRADNRKPIKKPAKPKRTQSQKDAAYIRNVLRVIEKRENAGLAVHISQEKIERMLAIADRLEKQK